MLYNKNSDIDDYTIEKFYSLLLKDKIINNFIKNGCYDFINEYNNKNFINVKIGDGLKLYIKKILFDIKIHEIISTILNNIPKYDKTNIKTNYSIDFDSCNGMKICINYTVGYNKWHNITFFKNNEYIVN